MAFKMKGSSYKMDGNKKIYKRMAKLEDKAIKLHHAGKDKKAQKKIDKISRLEDRATEGSMTRQFLRRKFGSNRPK